MESFINKFYHLDKAKYNKALVTSRKNCNAIRAYLDKHCGNENDVLRAIFRIGQSIAVLPNDLDMSLRSDYPREVNVVLESLHREFPSSPGYRSAEEAFHNIVSRYSQFGGEIDSTVDSIVSEIQDLRSSVATARKTVEQQSSGDSGSNA